MAILRQICYLHNISSSVERSGLWGSIWKIQCPNRIKHSLWRFANNSLALKCNLKRRGMELDSSCFISQRYDEDGAHLFFKCKWARKLWRELGWESVREQLSTLMDVKQCVELLLALPNEKRSLLAMLLNNLWWERNRVRGGESRSPQELAWLTWRQSEEFKELTKLHPGTRGNQ